MMDRIKQKRYVATIASYSKVVVKEEEVGDVRERSTRTKEAKAEQGLLTLIAKKI